MLERGSPPRAWKGLSRSDWNCDPKDSRVGSSRHSLEVVVDRAATHQRAPLSQGGAFYRSPTLRLRTISVSQCRRKAIMISTQDQRVR
jgi:hypothetical protein